jgi:hypothetical protein
MADGSDDDDAMPEEPVVSPSGMKMPLQMGGLGRQSGSQLFEEEDEAIKGGEVTLNIADESKEIQLKVGQCTAASALAVPHTHGPHFSCRSA